MNFPPNHNVKLFTVQIWRIHSFWPNKFYLKGWAILWNKIPALPDTEIWETDPRPMFSSLCLALKRSNLLFNLDLKSFWLDFFKAILCWILLAIPVGVWGSLSSLSSMLLFLNNVSKGRSSFGGCWFSATWRPNPGFSVTCCTEPANPATGVALINSSSKIWKEKQIRCK